MATMQNPLQERTQKSAEQEEKKSVAKENERSNNGTYLSSREREQFNNWSASSRLTPGKQGQSGIAKQRHYRFMIERVEGAMRRGVAIDDPEFERLHPDIQESEKLMLRRFLIIESIVGHYSDPVYQKRFALQEGILKLEKTLTTSTESDAKIEAISQLAEYRNDAVVAVPALCKALSDPSAAVRNYAAWGLGRIGDNSVFAAETALSKALQDKDPLVRQEAALALGWMNAEKAETRASLAELLTDRHWRVRIAAVEAIGMLGRAAADQSALLENARNHDSDPYVRRAAMRALGRVGMASTEDAGWAKLEISAVPSKEAAELTESLRKGLDGAKLEQQQQGNVQQETAKELNTIIVSLSEFGPRAKESAAVLASVFKDFGGPEMSETRNWAAWTLGRIGPDAKAAIPELRQALADADLQVRVEAAHALGLIGIADDKTISALLAAFEAKSRGVKLAAIEALGLIGPSARAAAHELLRFDRDEFELGMAAVVAQGRIGSSEPAVIETLMHRSQHSEKKCEKAAENALRRYRLDTPSR